MSCDPVNSGFEEYGREDQCSLQCYGVHKSFFDLFILFMLFVCSYIYSENATYSCAYQAMDCALDIVIIIYYY